MNNSNNTHLNILDLPDEILFIIFKKLNIVDVFYSLFDVNQRFNKLMLDSLYIRHLDITTIRNINSLYDQPSSINTQVVLQICEKILPRIHHQVHELTVEQDSIEQVLLAANYPQLYSLSLINFQEEILYQYLTNNSILRDLLTKQITHLNIDMKKPVNCWADSIFNLIALILSLCKNLTVLNFCDMFIKRKWMFPVFFLPSEISRSSTLTILKINVGGFEDCLLLLDGRFPNLSTLIINVCYVGEQLPEDDIERNLPNLKCFSLTSTDCTFHYDTVIIPLLRRMINLQELKLYVHIKISDYAPIDGTELFDQLISYMTQLHKFTFNIKITVRDNMNKMRFPSVKDIQNRFIEKGYSQVVSYADTKSSSHNDEYYMYSLPYDFEYYFDLNNSFQRGMFLKVRQLTMCYKFPFEHEFFQIVSHDFPFLEFLRISNSYQMQYKQNYWSTSITFPYLTFLDLQFAHIDYVELFLLKQYMHLPCLLNLAVEYRLLTNVTNDFTKDAMQFNFRAVESLDVYDLFVRPANFHHYFPLL